MILATPLILILPIVHESADKVKIGLENMKCRSMIVDFFMGIGVFLNLFQSFLHKLNPYPSAKINPQNKCKISSLGKPNDDPNY